MKQFRDFEECINSINTLENVVLFFTASWCGPCKVMYPIVEQLEEKLPMCHFFKIDVDVDETEYIVQHFGVSSMPTFFFIKNKEVQNKLSGANIEQFVEYLKILLLENIEHETQESETQESETQESETQESETQESETQEHYNLLETNDYDKNIDNVPMGSNNTDLIFSLVDDF